MARRYNTNSVEPTGFTIIEMIMVIAIISLFMAVLLPALQYSKQRARSVVCGSNVGQLQKGFLIYEMLNGTLPYGFDGTLDFPPAGGYLGDIRFDRQGWWWLNSIEGFCGDSYRTVFQCPSKRLANPILKDDILCGNYGVNQSICKSAFGSPDRREFIGMPLSSINISNPSNTLLIVDSGYALINWRHTTHAHLGNTIIEDTSYIPGLSINKDRNLWTSQKNDAINGRHPNKTVTVGFVDGHMGWVKADDLLFEKMDCGRHGNKRFLWGSEEDEEEDEEDDDDELHPMVSNN